MYHTHRLVYPFVSFAILYTVLCQQDIKCHLNQFSWIFGEFCCMRFNPSPVEELVEEQKLGRPAGQEPPAHAFNFKIHFAHMFARLLL